MFPAMRVGCAERFRAIMRFSGSMRLIPKPIQVY